MNIPCSTPSNPCFDPASPISNYSAETPDGVRFYGRNFGVGLVPPLGSLWLSPSCVGLCVSEVSQADADACAQRANILCLSGEWPVTSPNPNPGPNQPATIPTPRPVFMNDVQSCDFTCEDGREFTYVVPAGTYSAFTQAEADAIAHSVACNRAIDLRICIGELVPDFTCEGEDYSAMVAISMPSENFPIVVSIVAGALPVDMTLDYDPDVASFTIEGTVGVAGQYQFTVQVEDFDGHFIQKAFTLDVVEIATALLADGTVGNSYSQTLTTGGPVEGDVTWAVTSGSLPPGLTLNTSTGAITGIPTADGTYDFTVSMTDEH